MNFSQTRKYRLLVKDHHNESKYRISDTHALHNVGNKISKGIKILNNIWSISQRVWILQTMFFIMSPKTCTSDHHNVHSHGRATISNILLSFVKWKSLFKGGGPPGTLTRASAYHIHFENIFCRKNQPSPVSQSVFWYIRKAVILMYAFDVNTSHTF